jgi:hypothetical protein
MVRGDRLRAFLFVFSVAACSPQIHSFRAEPNVVCSGGATTLTWNASNDGTLSAVPADASLGAVSQTGTRAVTPAAPTTYRLTVKRLWKSLSREIGVEVVTAPTEAKQIGVSIADRAASVTCEANTLAATLDAPAASWDPHIQVATVALPAAIKRTYQVEHGGRSATLSPGAPSTAFAGLPVQGSWRLSTPLLPSEACGRNVPRSLVIEVASTCTSQRIDTTERTGP